VLATCAVIVIGKSLAAYAIVRLFGHSRVTALTVSVSLAQIGEFSFILATLGVSLGLLVPEAQDLILAGAILSIFLNPLLFTLLDRLLPRLAPPAPAAEPEAAEPPAPRADEVLVPTGLSGHAVVAGYGFVGRHLVEDLRALGAPFLVIDDRQDSMAELRAGGVEAITGNAADAKVLEAANIAGADRLLVALPNLFEAGQVVAKARKANPELHICARAETQSEVEHLRGKGADTVVVARLEVATAMIQDAFGPGAEAREAAVPEPLPPPVDDVVA
jgi:CPA2 family monovalent cation:H+ antiporter-2